MCKCDECDKKDTENCIRILEEMNAYSRENMLHIENDMLKKDIENQWKYIERILQLITLEQDKDKILKMGRERRDG